MDERKSVEGVVLEVTVKQSGIGNLTIKLEGTSSRLSDLTPAMKRASVLMMASVHQNFMSSGRPARWAPLSPAYLRRKLREGYSPLILIRSGLLRASIAQRVSPFGFRVGTSVPYARIHQQGGNAGRNHAARIPARPYLVFQEDDIERVNSIVRDYVKEGV